MSDASPPIILEPEGLKQSPEQLVRIILHQQTVIEQLQQEIERLKAQQRTDSQTSSLPPSTDLIKIRKAQGLNGDTEGKRKPGGQPGHPGRTRKGWSVTAEILCPQVCPHCGTQEFAAEPVAVQQQAQLVERPIEIVEYQRHSCQCAHCGQTHTAPWPSSIVPGQDMSVNLQALWHMATTGICHEKQQELLKEIVALTLGRHNASYQPTVFEAVQPAVSDLRD